MSVRRDDNERNDELCLKNETSVMNDLKRFLKKETYS